MSKERVVVLGEECRGEEEDWRCRRATGIWVEAAQASSQLFVEAHSSKGQAFSAIACTLQFLPEVMAPSSHRGTCLAESRCIAISMLSVPSI